MTTRTLLALVLLLALPGVAAAHGGAAHGGAGNAPDRALAAGPGQSVQLHGCHLTAVFVPRPAPALRTVLHDPLDLSLTFYGPDPLLGIWAFGCERAQIAGATTGRLVLSLVGVPVGLTSAGAAPLANNFAHRLIRLDSSSRRLAGAARRAGLPAAVSRTARYRHSRPGVLPSRGRLVVPGEYAMRVAAAAADPTNPHDHANLFEYRGGRGGRETAMTLSIANAFDRFCILPSDSCSASVRAPRASALARLLGGRSAPVRAGFDHERLPRVELLLRADRARLGPR